MTGSAAAGLEIEDLRAEGEHRYGRLGGSLRDEIADLCPVSREEWNALQKRSGKTWGYIRAALRGMREDAAQKPAQTAPTGGLTPQTYKPPPEVAPLTEREKEVGLENIRMILAGLGGGRGEKR